MLRVCSCSFARFTVFLWSNARELPENFSEQGRTSTFNAWAQQPQPGACRQSSARSNHTLLSQTPKLGVSPPKPSTPARSHVFSVQTIYFCFCSCKVNRPTTPLQPPANALPGIFWVTFGSYLWARCVSRWSLDLACPWLCRWGWRCRLRWWRCRKRSRWFSETLQRHKEGNENATGSAPTPISKRGWRRLDCLPPQRAMW